MGDKEITTKQLYDLIQGLIVSNQQIKEQITQSKDDIKGEISIVKEDLSRELHQIRHENEALKKETKTLNEKILKLEKTTKKYNLLVYNLEEQEDKTADLQGLIKILKEEAQVSCLSKDFRNFYRLGKTENSKVRPILIELVSYFLKEEILNNASKLKNRKVYISVDYTQKEYSNRKLLRKYLQIERNNNKTAEIKSYNLIVDGIRFTLDDLQKREAEEAIESGNTEKEKHQNRSNNITQNKRKPEESPEKAEDYYLKKTLRSGKMRSTTEYPNYYRQMIFFFMCMYVLLFLTSICLSYIFINN